MTAASVLVEVTDGVAEVRLNRPEKRNAIDASIFAGLAEAGEQVAGDGSVRAVVLSGEGRGFCAGLDMGTLGDIAAGELDAESDSVRQAASHLSPSGANRAQHLAWQWQELPVPVIAAVHGAAFGGGLNLALGADIRYVHPEARLAFVEVTWGLVPDMSATQSLRRLVPLDVAKELILSGREVSGREAVGLGLATRLTESPRDDARALARRIAGNSPDAVRAAKTLLNLSRVVDVAAGLRLEFESSAALMGTPNQIEAVLARLEGRPPEFTDPGPGD